MFAAFGEDFAVTFALFLQCRANNADTAGGGELNVSVKNLSLLNLLSGFAQVSYQQPVDKLIHDTGSPPYFTS